jgi:hypothetical protein
VDGGFQDYLTMIIIITNNVTELHLAHEMLTNLDQCIPHRLLSSIDSNLSPICFMLMVQAMLVSGMNSSLTKLVGPLLPQG